MADCCIVCECEAVSVEYWYYCRKTCEWVCNACVEDAHKVTELFQ